MPTYKNNRASALHLSTFTGVNDRMIKPEEVFTAHPSEVPKTWLESDRDNGKPVKETGGKAIVEKISDLPEVDPPRKPAPPAEIASKEALQAESKRQLLEQEAELERLKQETERLKKENLEREAALRAQGQPAAADVDAGKAAGKPEAAKPAKPEAAKPEAAEAAKK